MNGGATAEGLVSKTYGTTGLPERGGEPVRAGSGRHGEAEEGGGKHMSQHSAIVHVFVRIGTVAFSGVNHTGSPSRNAADFPCAMYSKVRTVSTVHEQLRNILCGLTFLFYGNVPFPSVH